MKSSLWGLYFPKLYDDFSILNCKFPMQLISLINVKLFYYTAIGIVVRKDMYLDWALAAIVVSPITLSNMSAYAKQGHNSI